LANFFTAEINGFMVSSQQENRKSLARSDAKRILFPANMFQIVHFRAIGATIGGAKFK
jgi:hypothetical protein